MGIITADKSSSYKNYKLVTKENRKLGSVNVGLLSLVPNMSFSLNMVTSQNGAWIPYHGNNWPLRGGKISIFEGGTRVASFVSGVSLQKQNYVFEGYIKHALGLHAPFCTAHVHLDMHFVNKKNN